MGKGGKIGKGETHLDLEVVLVCACCCPRRMPIITLIYMLVNKTRVAKL